MRERWGGQWLNSHIYHDPKRGKLEWCGKEKRPSGAAREQLTKMYVMDGWVGPRVEDVVEASKKGKGGRGEWSEDGRWMIDADVFHQWVEEAVELWKSQTPEPYQGVLEDVSKEEMFRLINIKEMAKKEFLAWLDQKAWDKADEQLERDMEALEVEEQEGWEWEAIEKWAKGTPKTEVEEGEVWGEYWQASVGA